MNNPPMDGWCVEVTITYYQLVSVNWRIDHTVTDSNLAEQSRGLGQVNQIGY